MPAAKKPVFDIDALLEEHRDAERAKIKYVLVRLFGREWRIRDQINNFMALRAGQGDVEAFTSFLMTCTHEDEREDFRAELFKADVMDPDTLLAIINNLMTAVADHPTKSSSGSSRSVKTRAGNPRSAAT